VFMRYREREVLGVIEAARASEPVLEDE